MHRSIASTILLQQRGSSISSLHTHSSFFFLLIMKLHQAVFGREQVCRTRQGGYQRRFEWRSATSFFHNSKPLFSLTFFFVPLTQGLLVSACINRAPEGTFGAAVAEVGVHDLLKVWHSYSNTAAYLMRILPTSSPNSPAVSDRMSFGPTS